MRVLIVDPDQHVQEREGEPQRPLSFFFAPDLKDVDSFDLVVLPVELFLSQPDTLPQKTPLLAYGPARLLADALAEGCSDYLREPWRLDELEARALRFWRLRFSLGAESYTYSCGRLEGRSSVIRLPEGERVALELLLNRLGKAVSREAFVRSLPLCCPVKSRLLDMSICRLRTKLARASGDSGAGAFLVAVRNYGYKLSGCPCG